LAAAEAAAYGGVDCNANPNYFALAWAILDADGVGTGTARIPALSCLGKGRKQASDGGAWSAAIADAAREAAGNLGSGPCWGVVHDQAVVMWTCADGRSRGGRHQTVPDELVPAAWQHSIAAKLLRQIVRIVDDYTEMDDEIARWAKLAQRTRRR
jgi:hypothetical protein